MFQVKTKISKDLCEALQMPKCLTSKQILGIRRVFTIQMLVKFWRSLSANQLIIINWLNWWSNCSLYYCISVGARSTMTGFSSWKRIWKICLVCAHRKWFTVVPMVSRRVCSNLIAGSSMPVYCQSARAGRIDAKFTKRFFKKGWNSSFRMAVNSVLSAIAIN